MAREHLKARSKAPGDDRTFAVSEANWLKALKVLVDDERYEVTSQPSDLKNLFGLNPDTGNPLGVVAETLIRDRTGPNRIYHEVKKQGAGGNAHERSYKHYTPGFTKLISDRFPELGYHPWATVWCERLGDMGRYTVQGRALIGQNNLVLWPEPYDLEVVRQHLLVVEGWFGEPVLRPEMRPEAAPTLGGITQP